MDTSKHLQAAEGYAELGMIEDALEELEQIPEEDRQSKGPTCLRLDIYNSDERWEEAARVAREGITAHPGCAHLYIMGAYAIRRAENSVEAALEFLERGHLCMSEDVPQRPLFLFNLGCYHAQLGNRNEALDFVNLAVEIDPAYKKLAMSDPDLEPVREELEGELG